MMMYRQTSAPTQPRYRGGSEMLVSTPRRSGRNQELNDRLQMKADELERLFAEHKHRIGGARKDSVGEHDGARSEVTRGEFYRKYAERRDSKLTEEWGSAKREDRAGRMKAMRESLERSSAELKAQPRQLTAIRDRDRLVDSNVREEEEDEKQFSDSSSKTVSSKTPQTKRSPYRSTGRTSTGRASTSSLHKAIPRGPSVKNAKTSAIAVKATPSAQQPHFRSSVTGTPSRKFPGKPLVPESAAETRSSFSGASDRGASHTGKKWGPDATRQWERKDAGKGIIRFLQFGRKARSADRDECRSSSVNGPSAVTTASEYQFPSYDGFSDGAVLLEQAQTRGIDTFISTANLKEDQSQRGTSRTFFSLPSFRNRGGETKLGR